MNPKGKEAFMETVLLGIAVALLWGSADTLAAVVTQRIGSAATTLVAQVAGLLLVAFVALVVGMPADLSFSVLTESMLSGIVLGAIGALAYLTLYKALEHGPLAVASPLVSAQGGVTLLAAIVVLHEMPGMWQMVFLLLIFAGVMLASIDGRAVNRFSALALLSPGVALALVSMAGFGLLAFGLGLAARETNWLLCVVWTRIFSCLLLTIFFRLDTQATAGQAESTSGSKQRRDWWFRLSGVGAVGVGCADVGGLLLLALASTAGSIGLVGMVASAYGIIPLAAGILVFKERPESNQLLGVALLIAGLLGVATPSPTLNWPLLGSVGALLLAFVSIRPCSKLLSTRLAIPPEWATLAREVCVLAPPQQQELLGLLRETVVGLDTLAPTRIPPCVAFFGSAHTTPDGPAYTAAYETARRLAEAGFGIITNSTCGIMEAANRGACEGGMLSVACVLDQADRREAGEECTNTYPDVVLRFSRVASRLMTVCAAANAFVIFPGGLDTLDDLYQAVHAVQAGEMCRVPIVLYESSFWNRLFDWMPDKLFEAGTIDPDVPDLFHLCDKPAEIAAYVTACLFPDRIPHQEGQQETELSIKSRN
jgi:uncharacterized protein (TIGR00730 family)